jgi:hypothetical protein
MARYDQNSGMWVATAPDGTRLGLFPDQASAQAAEGSGTARTGAGTDEEFARSSGGLQTGESQLNILRPEQTAEELEALYASRRAREEEERLRNVPYGTPVSQGGTATQYQVEQHPVGTINTTQGGIRNAPPESVQIVQPGVMPGAPGSTTRANADRADDRTNQAEVDFRNEQDQNAAENDARWADAFGRFDDLDPANYGLSDEARGYQREGLQQQRELLERLLGFDPNQYATQFADQALARSVALARSAPGGAAAQQAGTFAALEQMPELQAEGARQAAGLENQRLQAAQAVTKTFGDLGTMTRGQDETRAQFDAELPLEIAKSVGALTQGAVQLNQQESEMFAQIWMDFAQLQSVYDRMSLDEQLAWWDDQTKRYGIDRQFEAVKAQLKAEGKVSAKDIIGGLFTLGGGIISGGASILAAGAKG